METNKSDAFREIEVWESKNHWKILPRWQSLFINGFGYRGGGGGESAVAEAHQQLTVLNATIAVDCAAHMLNLQCINAPKALNCFSVNITCNGLPMMIKVDYSKLTANEKRDKKISLSSWSLSCSCPSASLFVFTVSSYHLLVLFSFHLVGLWDFLGFGFTPPPLPRWDVSPLQITPQHFIRFPWQQYPYNYNPGWRGVLWK